MNRKQEIYIEVLECGLPRLRDMAHGSYQSGVPDPAVELEAELLHNLPSLLRDPDFGIRDVCMLNTQVFLYCEDCRKRWSDPYFRYVPLFIELFAMVPEDLRSELTWNGPEADD